jgi:zinc transport system substrate-binding protein
MSSRIFLRTAAAAAALSLAAIGPSRAEVPAVVASIAPLHSLVAMVMDGVGSPRLLLRGSASPHGYALRPSQRRALAEAWLIVRVGPALEAFLDRPLAAQRKRGRVLDALEIPGMRRYPLRKGGVWQAAEHDHDHDHDHDREKGHDGARDADGTDPHIWLDPHNAGTVVAAIARRLAEIDPANAAAYARNAASASATLEALESGLRDTLTPVRDAPFVVLHDGWQYFERAFGLRGAGAIALSPERRPGARRIAALRKHLTAAGVRCVFSEPQFPAAIVETVVRGTGSRTAPLDPLGATLSPGKALYPALMRAMARTIADCLRPAGG